MLETIFTVVGSVINIAGGLGGIATIIMLFLAIFPNEKAWSLTKIEGNYWKLERRYFLPASIVGASLIPFSSGKRIQYLNSSDCQRRLKQGEHIIFEVLPLGSKVADLKLVVYYKPLALGGVYSEKLLSKLINHEISSGPLGSFIKKVQEASGLKMNRFQRIYHWLIFRFTTLRIGRWEHSLAGDRKKEIIITMR